MKVLSFDVGIKNLAYCCIESGESEDNNTFKRIFAWNIINLIPENPHCYISSCKKPAIQTCMYHGHAVNWCKKHNSIYATLNKAVNKDKTGSNANDILTKPTNVHIINCKTINTDDLRKSIIKNLDMQILPLIYKHNIDYVLIENQPVKKNPLMKQVMDTLYCWFLIRCICDRQIVKSINLINPSNKLKEYGAQLNTYDENSKEKYKATKNMSIEVVQNYLQKNNLAFLTAHLEKYSKKDDLCDSLLQGFYWIDKAHEEENKKQKKIAKNKVTKTTNKVTKTANKVTKTANKVTKTKKTASIITDTASDLLQEASKTISKQKRGKKGALLDKQIILTI